MSTTRTRDLTVGAAEDLAAAGIGDWAPSGAYPPSPCPAIFTKAVPPTPDRVVALTPYTVADEVLGHRVQGMQVRTRGGEADPLDVDDLDDAIYQAWHGRENVTFGGVPVHLIYRASHGTLGTDGDHRTENVSNYYFLMDAPTPFTR